MNMTNRITDLSVIWKQTSMIFPGFDKAALDWDGAYREYLPRVMEARTEPELHLLLAEFLNLPCDGHTDYTPPRALLDEIGYLPFSLDYVRGLYCIDGTADGCGEYLCAHIRSINGIPISRLIWELKRYCYHVGDFIPRYRLNQLLPFLLKREGNLAETSSGSFVFGLLPKKPDSLRRMPLTLPEVGRSVGGGGLDIRLFDGNILCIRMDDLLYPRAAEEVRTAIRDTPEITGVILDLRENIGGMTLYGARVAELFISGTFHGCRKRTRSMTGIALSSASQIAHWSEETAARQIAAGHATAEEIERSQQLMANTHCDSYLDTFGSDGNRAIYTGPCVILTSRHTVSAAEDLVAMFRSNRRATILGTETCGTTGTPFLQELSCGGRIRICSVAYQLLDGTGFIGRGIMPDIRCDPAIEDLQRGYDRGLAGALHLLRDGQQTGEVPEC